MTVSLTTQASPEVKNFSAKTTAHTAAFHVSQMTQANQSSTVSLGLYSFLGVRFKLAAACLSPTPIANELTLKRRSAQANEDPAETFFGIQSIPQIPK